MKSVVRMASGILVAAALVIVVAIIVVPAILGLQRYVITGGSVGQRARMFDSTLT